jgi:hypothetical protein
MFLKNPFQEEDTPITTWAEYDEYFKKYHEENKEIEQSEAYKRGREAARGLFEKPVENNSLKKMMELMLQAQLSREKLTLREPRSSH